MPSERNTGAAFAPTAVPPPMARRVGLACIVGMATAVIAWYMHRGMMREGIAPDSLAFWRGARLLLSGLDPYDAIAWSHMPLASPDPDAWRIPLEPLYYPVPALLLWAPFAQLSFLVGSAAFTALGAALFAFAVTREGLHRAWLCAGVPFLVAVRFGQWSPWLTAAALIPALAFLLPAKPNLGVAIAFAGRPTWRAIFGCVTIIAASQLIMPHWVSAWWSNIAGALSKSGAPHPIPLTQFGGAGALLLVALLRWRRSEARLLLLMACVPQLPFWADQLVLATVPRSPREVIWTLIAGHAGFLLWLMFAPKVLLYVPAMQPYALVGTYLPALIVVLRRPNVGAMPAWVERTVRRWPEWVRGAPVISATAT